MERQRSVPADYELRFEPSKKRGRVEFNGALIANSERALVVCETRLPPAYYFPAADVRMDLLFKTAHTTHCPLLLMIMGVLEAVVRSRAT